MIIRSETSQDFAPIREVISTAFGRAREADLVAALRAAKDSVYEFVVENDGAVVGHIMFSKLQAPDGCIALAPVSVVPSEQNQGIGSKLIGAGITRAKADGWCAVFLLGDPAYYERFGFSVAAAARYTSVYPAEFVMAIELMPGGLSNDTNSLIYAAPFLDLE